MFLLLLGTLEDTERELIGRLYSDYSKRVKKLAIHILRDDIYADDAVNDTFLKVIKYKEKFLGVSEDERVRLIIICTRSVCFNIYNRGKKLRFESLESFNTDDEKGTRMDIPDSVDLSKLLVNEETVLLLKRSVDRLNAPSREMIILKYYDDMKNTEIADFYGMNPSTVGTIIQRSIKILRKDLGWYFNDTDK